MTDTCKNITFPQLRLWLVIKEIGRDVPWRATPSPRSANDKGVLRVGLCCMQVMKHANQGTQPNFETQVRCHQKSKTGEHISVAPQKGRLP